MLKVNLEISKIESLRFNCVEDKYRPDLALYNIRGRKYLTNIEKSKWNCFLSCLTYHYLTKFKAAKKVKGIEDAARYEHYYNQFISQINFEGTGIDYPYNKPVSILQMKKLLKNNKNLFGDLQVNILRFIDEKIYAYETGIGARETENVLNMLSIPLNDINNEDNKKTQEHLTVINDLAKFLYNKKSKARYPCLKCLNFFNTKERLKKHKFVCNNPRGQAEFAPEPGACVEFKNWNRKYMTPVTGFLDFETFQQDSADDPEVKHLKAYQYSLIFVDQNMNLIHEERKFSPEGRAGQLAVDSLLNIEARLFKRVRRKLPMMVTKQEKAKLRKATHCHICEKKFTKQEAKHIDHDHYDGKVLG